MRHESLFAFVLMPFEASFDDRYRLGIKEAARELDILAERVDEQRFKEGIVERIYRQIEAADIVIADMTGKNPNVFYEVGYAHAKGKLTILLTSDVSDIPFDLKHRRHIVYGSITDLRGQLTEELKWAKIEVENVRGSRIKVSARTSGGDLTRTSRSAAGVVLFTVDLLNVSQIQSPEIDALYFYCTKKWKVHQDGKECGWTDSDLAPFEKRSFLHPTVRRLAPGSWAQVKFSTEAILAVSSKGEEIKDSYRLTGRSVLRIATSEGNFDHQIDVDALIEEFPF